MFNSRRELLRSICARILPVFEDHGGMMPLPEYLKRCAVECFLYPYGFRTADEEHIRIALLELAETGMISDEFPDEEI